MFILLDYLKWHYGEALGAILTIQKNYLTGAWHRFMIGQHFRTLFSPWHRRQPSDFGRAVTMGGKLLDRMIDFYIRILAALVRSSIIITGLIWSVIIYLFFWVLFLFWLLWPITFLILLVRGVTLIL